MELTKAPTKTVSIEDNGRIKKETHPEAEVKKIARKSKDRYDFVFNLMNLSLEEIEYEIEKASKVNFFIRDKKSGLCIATCKATNLRDARKEAENRYPNDDVEIYKSKPNYSRKKRYQDLKQEYESLLKFYDDLGPLNFYTPVEELWEGKSVSIKERYQKYFLYERMAKELNIIGFKEEKDYKAMDKTWYRSLGLQGNGIEFYTENGESIYLDMGIEGYNHLYIDQFAINSRGKGLGTKVMEILKEFMTNINGNITVQKVCNPKFFDRFDWLVPDEGKWSYEFNSRKQNKSKAA